MQHLKKLHTNKTFLRLLPLLCLVIVWIIFSFGYLVKGTVPYPSDYQVNHFPPWSSYPEFASPVKNNAMPDIVDQIYPWRHFSVEEVKRGVLPFWNPYSFSGNPHVANFQSAAFSPVTVLFLLLPFLLAWSLAILVQPLIAGISMYVFVRENGVSRHGALLSAVSFMFCGFIVVWMAYGTLSLAISFLPLVLFFLKRYIESGKILFGFFLSTSLVFSVLSGHFQTSLYVLLFTVLYGIFLAISEKRYKRGILASGFFLLALAICVIQIAPTIQLYLLSPRNDSFITGGGIPWNYLITLVAPDFYGNPVTRNDWFGYYAEWASFVGIIPLSFALLTLTAKKKKVVLFLWGSVIFFLVLVISSPMQAFMGSLKIPVFSTSSPSRVIVLVSFLLSILAGFGLDSLKNLLERKNKRLFLPFALLLGVFVSVWIVLLTEPFLREYTSLAMRNFVLPTLLFGSLIGGIFMTYLFSKKTYFYSLLIVLVIVLAYFDSLRFVTKWMPSGNPELVFPALDVITKMESLRDHGRVFGNIGAQVTTYYRIPGIEGYDPLYIDRYGQFVNASRDGLFHSSERSVVKASPRGKYTDRLLDITGVTLIYHPISDTNQSWAYPIWDNPSRFEEVFKDDYIQLFRNKTAIPRGTVFFSYEIIPDERNLLKRFYSDEFDYRNTLLLEKDPEFSGVENATEEEAVEFVKDDPTHIVFDVTASREGMLFLSDNYYPGWKAFVNGVEKEVFRANYTFRAVKIPEGESRVEFVYSFSL